MAYSIEEQLAQDILWYFRDSYNHLCVALSAGGLLPQSVAESDLSNNEFHAVIYGLPEVYEIARNEAIINRIQGISLENLERYFLNFESLARRGLYVFDKFAIDNASDPNYFLVAYPIYDRYKNAYPINKQLLSEIPRIRGRISGRYKNPFNLIRYFDNLYTLGNNRSRNI